MANKLWDVCDATSERYVPCSYDTDDLAHMAYQTEFYEHFVHLFASNLNKNATFLFA